VKLGVGLGFLKPIVYRGTSRHCPICQSSVRRFLPFGVKPRQDARCPLCGSLERHRLLWLFLRQYTDLFDGSAKRMLHFAPEMEKWFKTIPGLEYLSADLVEGRAMLRMDITDIRYPDNSFEVLLCSHVLEHVPDDRKAMLEIARVLKPEGWAVIIVPIRADPTFEDPSVSDPAERERLFGQRDHVRIYGQDFEERLKETGLRVWNVRATQLANPDEVVLFGLKDDEIFVGTKEKMTPCER